MIGTLTKTAIWPATLIVLAVIGAVTYLGSQGVVSGSDIVTIMVLILTGVIGVTATHVAGNVAVNAASPPAQPAGPTPGDLP